MNLGNVLLIFHPRLLKTLFDIFIRVAVVYRFSPNVSGIGLSNKRIKTDVTTRPQHVPLHIRIGLLFHLMDEIDDDCLFVLCVCCFVFFYLFGGF